MNFFEPYTDKDGVKCYIFDPEKFYQSLSTTAKKNYNRRSKVMRIEMLIYKKIPWLHWPVINLATVFWTSLAEEGRMVFHKWGSLSFAFLNDGIRPTIWHTYNQIFHSRGKYSGIYVRGAPKSRKQAEEWEKSWGENASKP